MKNEKSLPGIELRSEALEEKAVRGFETLFEDFSEEGIAARAPGVYAEDAYFNDTLKMVRGRQQITEYLRESAAAVEECQVQMRDRARSGADYYFRWSMQIVFKKIKKGQRTSSEGISHIRFNEAGEVVYHQDYWDAASGLFEHIPLLGAGIRLIKRRL